MKIDILKAGGIDYDDGLARFVGMSDLYESLLLEFLNEKDFAGAKKSLHEGDFESAFNYMHTLKGVSGNLSIKKVYNGTADIVAALRSGDVEKACALFPAFEEIYNDARNTINNAK